MTQTETQPAPAATQVPPAGRPQLRQWTLTVTGTQDAPANMRRVTFSVPDLAEFEYRAGQAIVMMLPTGEGSWDAAIIQSAMSIKKTVCWMWIF